MHKVILFVVTLGAVVFAPAQAFAADVMSRISSDKLAAMLTSGGATQVETKKPETGVEIVSFNDGAGPLDLVLMGCTADGCQSIQMTATFEKNDKVSLSTVNSFNAKVLNAHAALSSEGYVLLVRHYVLGGGVTEDNLKFNIVIFLQAPQMFIKHVNEQVTVSLDKPGTMKPVVAPAAAPTLTLGLQAPAAVDGFDVAKWHQSANRPRRRLP